MKAPAKINLLLRVLTTREDGNHNIESVMQAIDLYDDIEVEVDDSDSSDYEIVCRTEGAELPDGKDNLAYRAAQIFLEQYKINCNVNIRIVKRIPIAAGLAGGSADAAAVLLSLAVKYKPDVSLAELANLGVKIGADVPFQIYSCARSNPLCGYDKESYSTAVASGIGEKLTPVYPTKTGYVLLVNPGIDISAGEAYQLFDRAGKASESASSDDFVAALRNGDGSAIMSSLSNDLMPPVADAYKGVKELMAQMTLICERNGGKAMMSGSGSTVFGLFYNENEACKAYGEAQEAFPGMFSVLAKTI